MDTSISSDTRNAEHSQVLLGVWKLQDWIYTNRNTGESTHPFGITPYGFITFGEDGQYFESIVRSVDSTVSILDSSNPLHVSKDDHVVALTGIWNLSGGELSVKILNSYRETVQGSLLSREIHISQDRLSLCYSWESEHNTQMSSTSTLKRWQPGNHTALSPLGHS